MFAEEPAQENILFGMEGVVATPHLGAATTEAQEKVALQVAQAKGGQSSVSGPGSEGQCVCGSGNAVASRVRPPTAAQVRRIVRPPSKCRE